MADMESEPNKALVGFSCFTLPVLAAERHKPHSWATVARSGESAWRTCEELEDEMAYVIVNDFEGGTREQYDATTAVVHPAGGLPPGQTHHYAGPSTNGWVVVAVWESKEIWEKFRDETLLPAFQGGGSVLPGPPKTTEFEVELEL
jgi:hypothetical protein